jgi:hypothetical protein
MEPSDPALRELKDWITGPLVQQWDDAARFLAEEVGNRTWALIELSTAENVRERTWADAIILDLISEGGAITTHRIPCVVAPEDPEATPEGEIRRGLREAVAMLPAGGEVLVDLCLPRPWLDAGMEDWEVVYVGGDYESMTDYKPRLRWSLHRNDPMLRRRLTHRGRAIDRSLDPYAIPPEITGDRMRFQEWLRDRNEERTVHPYFTGISPLDGAHDPLGLLLREGYGFAVWFPPPTASPEAIAAACAQAARFGDGAGQSQERLDDLPGSLAAKFRKHRPVIVWSDPDGREGFPLPAPRGDGMLRGGGV